MQTGAGFVHGHWELQFEWRLRWCHREWQWQKQQQQQRYLNLDKTFLRGIEQTDSNEIVQFATLSLETTLVGHQS
jgi:hypothetical protein